MVQTLRVEAKHVLIASFAALAALRFWFAWHFNPYWGYDGGGHLEYIFSLSRGEWPSTVSNYIAWHEPLYYLLMAPVWKLFGSLKALSFVQACLSLGVAWLSWLIIGKLTEKTWVRFASFMTWNLLPPVFLASTFVTNELLNYFFILLMLYLGLSEKSQGKIYQIAVICGLAVLTKITAIVAIGALLLSWRDLRKSVVILAITAVFYAPWLMHRGQLSVNNTEYLPPAPLTLDSRLAFFFKFDTDIFQFPFWYSGGRGFWSMIYADTFWDYYSMMKNPDMLAQLPVDQRIPTDHNGGVTTSYKLKATSWLPLLAIPLAIVMLLGAFQLLKNPLALPTLISGGLFAALLYFSYRYPFYDKGIVKSIFIGPAFLPMLTAGFSKVSLNAKLSVIFVIPIVMYLTLLLKSLAIG